MFVLVFVDFLEDYIVLLIIYVVEVIVYGVYEIFQLKCGVNYDFVCLK